MLKENLRVGIVGAGAIACGVAVLLETNGHIATLWSPSGKNTQSNNNLVAQGVIEGVFHPRIANSAKELVETSDVILFALPVNGHKNTIDAISPHIDNEQQIIISSHASFGALYAEQTLKKRGINIPIVAWSTTAVTARKIDLNTVNLTSIRKKIEIATIPNNKSDQGLILCKSLFYNDFEKKSTLLETILSNLNPEVHMAMALCNLTRMEQGEDWCQRKNITPTVGRLIERLDEERLAIASAFGCTVKSIFDNYKASSNTTEGNVSSINQTLHLSRVIMGPKIVDSRYVLEDAPYGLLVIAKLGSLVGSPAPNHEAGITLFSTLYGRDFSSENTLLTALDFDNLTPEQILKK